MWNYYFCLTFVYRSLPNTQAIPSNFSLASITITHILSPQSSVFSLLSSLHCNLEILCCGLRTVGWGVRGGFTGHCRNVDTDNSQAVTSTQSAEHFSLIDTGGLQVPGPQGCYKNKLELYFEHLHTKCGTQAESAHTGRSVWAPAKNGLQMNVYRIHSLYENRVRVCNGGS